MRNNMNEQQLDSPLSSISQSQQYSQQVQQQQRQKEYNVELRITDQLSLNQCGSSTTTSNQNNNNSSRHPNSSNTNKYNKSKDNNNSRNLHQKLFYAKSMNTNNNNNHSFRHYINDQSDQSNNNTPSSCFKYNHDINNNNNRKERSNKSVMLLDNNNSVEYLNEQNNMSKDLDNRSINQIHSSHLSSRQSSNYPHQFNHTTYNNNNKVRSNSNMMGLTQRNNNNSMSYYHNNFQNRASSFSQHSQSTKRNGLSKEQTNLSFNIINNNNNNNEGIDENYKGNNSSLRSRKISFANKEQEYDKMKSKNNNKQQQQSEFVFQFPPQQNNRNSSKNSSIFKKQYSFISERIGTASTRPQTTNQQQHNRNKSSFEDNSQKQSIDIHQQNNQSISDIFQNSFVSNKNNNQLHQNNFMLDKNNMSNIIDKNGKNNNNNNSVDKNNSLEKQNSIQNNQSQTSIQSKSIINNTTNNTTQIIDNKNNIKKRKESISFLSSNNNNNNINNNNNVSQQSKRNKKPQEIRNQYDLDKGFLTIFNQTQFSHGEGNNCSNKYLQQKQITLGYKNNERKSLTSNSSAKRASIPQVHTDLILNIHNNNNNNNSNNNNNLTTILNATQSPQQHSSILKKRLSKNINYPLSQSPKLSKYENILDEVNYEKEENTKKIEQNLKDIEEDNFRNIFPNLKEILSKAVDTNDLKLFVGLSEFMGDLAYEMNDFDAATFLFDQFRQLSTYTRNHSKKAKSLLFLAKCARAIHSYSEAIVILKKALQYAWYAKQNDIELEIYDEFGRNYYYQGNIQKAHYYHERFMNGEYEDDDSPTKQFSEENLNTFQKTIEFTFQDVTSLLLAYLKIPIYTLDQMGQYGNINQTNYIQGKTPRININDYNQMYFDKCNSKDIIQKIITEDEFYIQIQSPKFQVKGESIELSVLAQKRLNKMMFRQRKPVYDLKSLGKIDLDSKMRDYSNPFKYKVSLDKKIEYLKKQKIEVNIDEKLEKVRQARSQQKEEDIRNRVYNNSLYKHNPKIQNQSRKPITNNYKNIYKNIIIDYILKNNHTYLFDFNYQ